MKKNRRNFLKKTSLGVLSLGTLPNIAISQSKRKKLEDCNETTQDYYGEGPFYTVNAPVIQNNQLVDNNKEGERLIISGRVYNLNCTEVIPNTEIDIWHADNNGAYDVTGSTCRGKTYSNSQGFYIFETIKPGLYLNGSTYRPSHIHFKITPTGHPTLITQLYFNGDPYIQNDAAASIDSGQFDATNRIVPISLNGNGSWEGNWDIIIDGDGIASNNDIHLDKGIIYQTNPNPFKDILNINFGVFSQANTSLAVYNINGKLIACLKKEKLNAGKYEITWRPEHNLPNGHYFIALKINDLQVHYLKVIKHQ